MRSLRLYSSFLIPFFVFVQGSPAAEPAQITVDYPSNGSVFPPDIAPPMFLWRDLSIAAAWRIEVVFGDRSRPVSVTSKGEKYHVGEIDENCVGYVPPTLTPEQQQMHTWRPDPATWEAIKSHSRKRPAAVTITGLAGDQEVSTGRISIETSKDPVGAPILYRDVPLIPPGGGERGVIKPLPDSAIPKIKWQLRSISETRNKTVMQGLPTCANCHSVSRDGKTLGIDVDGPQNDKALYGLVPIEKVSHMSNDHIVRWSAFTEQASPKRFGFMSQVSPDGRYVVTSIEVPGTRGRRVDDRIYQGFYPEYGFGQVFYPTRGLLAWYSRETGKLQRLPGADDPKYVQTSAFWSPDGKYLVYSRALARNPYAKGQPPARYANDPNETQIQYDLYRVPFNNGKGGAPERIAGASENGMSNNFPKVSPDGKWIVFVQNKTGLLMRPDSHLYIVPSSGGTARPLNSNQQRMNSWHSFSPNGKWLVFSSKARSLYTQMYLTHIDENGNDSPAILIEDATAANRAVNIPEFVNIRPDGLERIETPAVEFYGLFNEAAKLSESGKYEEAIPAWKKAVAAGSDDARSHTNLGNALAETGRTAEAIESYQKALELDPTSSKAHNNLGAALAEAGRMDEAIARFEKALELAPDNASAHSNLGGALAAKGRTREAIEHFRKALEIYPYLGDAENNLGDVLAMSGALDEALPHFEKAVSLEPGKARYRFNYGRLLAAKGRFAEAVTQLEEAVKLSGMRQTALLEMLSALYAEVGRYADAVTAARRGLDIATEQGNSALAATLRQNLARYEAQARQAGGAGR